MILDQEEYLKNGTAVIVTTLDVQLHPSEFPFRTAGWAEPNLDKLSSAFTRHYHRRLQVQGQKYDRQGRPICILCEKLLTDAPVTCGYCLTGAPHKKKNKE